MGEQQKRDVSRELLLARFYDAEYHDYSEDLDFYVQFARLMDPEQALPLLELGCGTGRVLIALASAGFRVVGVDSSEAMLQVARANAEEARVTHLVELKQADMAALNELPAGALNMSFCALNTFSYLLSTKEQLAALNSVRERLVPHGLLILDLTPPFPHLLAPSDGELLHQGTFVDRASEEVVHKFVSGRVDQAMQLHDVTVFYDLEGKGGLERYTVRQQFRWLGRYELELLLNTARYRLEHVYGSYDLDDFDSSSQRLIVVART